MKSIVLRSPYLLYYFLQFRRSAWRDIEEIEKDQWKRFKAILNHAYEHCKIYHQKFKSVNLRPEDITKKDDLLKIPIITKEELRRDPLVKFLANNYKIEDCFFARTSGSTGKPLHFVMDLNALLQKIAINLRTCEMANFRLGEKFLQVSPPIDIGSIQALDILLRRKYLSPFKRDSRRAIETIAKFKPSAIVGYTSYIKLLSEVIRNFKMHDLSLNSIMTTSELLLPNIREKIEEAFNTELFDQYGSVEFGRVSGECSKHYGYHINSETSLVEFVRNSEHCAQGESGEIIITSLINKAMPFIRYKIEDLGKPLDDGCNCGRGLPLMEILQGRIQDLLCTADNSFVIPDKAYHILRKYDEIRQFQVIQKANKNIVIKIIEDKPLPNQHAKSIIEQFKNYLGEIEVEINNVKEIPLDKGKHHYIISLV